jgi:hypothetical protein
MRKRRGAKLHRILAFLAALLIFCLAPCEVVSADYQGLDDYLAGSSDGINYFTNEIVTARSNANLERQMLERLQNFMNDVEATISILGVDTWFVYKGTAETELPKTIYNGVTGDFITLKREFNRAQYVAYQNKINELERSVQNRDGRAAALNTVYRGFSVVGTAQNPNGNAGFAVHLQANNILGSYRQRMENELYGGAAEYDNYNDDDSEVGDIERMIAEPLGNGAFNLYMWMSNWNVDITIDGLIFGRLSPTYKGNVDFTHFGMEENNPYGVVAAVAYYVLRRIVLGVIPVLFMAMLLGQLFNNTQKGRAQLKEAIGNFLLAIALLFVAPYAVEIAITLRDGIMKASSLGMGSILSAVGLGNGVGSNVIGLIYITYERNHTLLNALIWLAAVGAGVAYLISYIQIAMLLTGCVAILPIVLFISIYNPKIIKDWWNTFFPNLCVPLIDLILLQIPAVILLTFKNQLGARGGSIVLGFLILIVMWNSLMIRDRVVKLLGFEGLRRTGGGLLAAAVMAARMASRSVSGGRRGEGGSKGEGDGGLSVEEAQKLNKEQQRLHNEALGGVKEMEDAGAEGRDYDPAFASNTENYINGLEDADAREEEARKAAEAAQQEEAEGTPAEEIPDGEAEGVPAEGEGGAEPLDEVDYEGEIPEEVAAADSVPAGELGEVDYKAEGATVDGKAVLAEDASVDGRVTAEGGVPGTEGEVSSASDLGSAGGAGQAQVASAFDQDPAMQDGKEFFQSRPHPDRSPYLEGVGTRPDDGFREQLGDADRKRYDNLTRMDAYNDKIAANEKEMRAAGYSKGTYEKDRATFVEQENRLNATIDRSREKLRGMTEGTDEYNAEFARRAEMIGKKREIQERVAQLDHAARLDSANGVYRENVARAAQTEAQYAKAQKVGGMSDRTYQSAHDFETQRKFENVQREVASYKNFDSKRFEGILTPAEKENFYRERVEREKMAKARQAALSGAAFVGKTAAVGAGVVASFGAAYGGEKAMADVGMVSHYAATRLPKVATGAAHAVTGARDVGVGVVTAGQRTARKISERREEKARNANSNGNGPATSTPSTNLPSGNGSGSVRASDLAESARRGERHMNPDAGGSGRPQKGSGNSSAQTIGRNAGKAIGRRNEKKPNVGSGKSSPETLARNAEKAGGHGNAPKVGSGKSNPEVMARNAEKASGENVRTPKVGSGKSSPEVMAKNAEKAENKDNKGNKDNN